MLDEFAQRLQRGLVDRSLKTPSRWATHKIYTPPPHAGPLSFDKFPWQREILDAEDPMVVVQKAAQMGFSVAALIKSLFTVDERGLDVLYVLPTAKLAGKFAKSRLDAIVALSPELNDLFIGSNSVGLKTTAKHSHIIIAGSISESDLVSHPVSVAIVDEFDRCNPKAMSLVMERLSAHEKKHFFGLSTPTLPNSGINREYLLGTQERFMFPCPSCSRTIELLWPESIEICGESPTDENCHKSYLKCYECGAELPHKYKSQWLSTAHWIPRQQAHGRRSFHINQMYGYEMSPGELVVAYLKGEMSEVSKVEFVNQKLGEPYLMEGARLTDAIIDECLGDHRTDDPNIRPRVADRQIVMGVDVGTHLDVAIVEYLYDADPGYEPHLHSVAKVLWTGRFAGDDWGSLSMLMGEWQAQYVCIDFQPETTLAKAFARNNHGYCSVVQYRQGTTAHEIKEQFDSNRVSILTVDRTAFLDMVTSRFRKGRIILPRNLSPVAREHFKNIIKTYEYDEFGRPKAVYEKVRDRDDHQIHALAFAEVAHLKAYTRKTGRSIRPGEQVTNL